jgi:hypothetical protein
MDVMQRYPNHQYKWLFHICESNFESSWLLVWTHPPWIALTNLCAIHDMMGVYSRFEIWRLLSQLLWTLGVAQHWRGCCLIKESCPLLVQILFFGWIQSLRQWNLSKGSNVAICEFIKILCVVYRGLKFWTPSLWNIDANSPSTKGLNISMATFFVHPSGIWVGTSMSFSCGGTSPSHWENKAFTCGCAFEHTTTLVRPLPSYQ